MAVWPLARIRDFIANQTIIPAELMNKLQDWVIDLSLGQVSLKSVVIDRVGGVAQAIADAGLHILFDADNYIQGVTNAGIADFTVAGPAGKYVRLGAGIAAGPGWSLTTNSLELTDADGVSTLTSGLIPKAWGQIQVSAGGAVTLQDGEGFVKASTVITGQQLKIILSEPIVVGACSVTATNDATAGLAAGWCQAKKISSTEFRIEWYGAAGSQYDPATAGARVGFHVFARGT